MKKPSQSFNMYNSFYTHEHNFVTCNIQEQRVWWCLNIFDFLVLSDWHQYNFCLSTATRFSSFRSTCRELTHHRNPFTIWRTTLNLTSGNFFATRPKCLPPRRSVQMMITSRVLSDLNNSFDQLLGQQRVWERERSATLLDKVLGCQIVLRIVLVLAEQCITNVGHRSVWVFTTTNFKYI